VDYDGDLVTMLADFGEPITLTNSLAVATPVTAIVDIVNSQESGGMNVIQTTLITRTSQVQAAGIAVGDTATFRGKDYRIVDLVPDEPALTHLMVRA
jgi:hypothetical protein